MSERKYTNDRGKSKYPGWPPPRGVIRDLPEELYWQHAHLDTGRGLDIGLVRRIEEEARAEMAEIEEQRMMDAVVRNAERMRVLTDRESPHRVEDTPDTVCYCRDCARTLPSGCEGEVCDSCQEFTERARETRVKALAHRWENGLSLTWPGCCHTEAEALALLGLGENRTPFDPVGDAWRELHSIMNGYGQHYVRGRDHQAGDPLVPLFDTAADAYDREHPLYGQWPDAV